MNNNKKFLLALMATVIFSGLNSRTMYDYDEDPNLPLGVDRTPDTYRQRRELREQRGIKDGPQGVDRTPGKGRGRFHGSMMQETPLRPGMHQKGFSQDNKTLKKIMRKLEQENKRLKLENARLKERMMNILRNTRNN